MTYAEILNHVIENGRITTNGEEDPESYLAEVKAEVEFEASEREESGDLDGTVKGAVEFAVSHVS